MIQAAETYQDSSWSAGILPAQRLRWNAALLEVMPGALIVRDLQDRVIFWNRGAEALYGRSAEDVLGRTMLEGSGHDPVLYRQALRRLIADGAWNGELSLGTTASGRPTIVSHRWRLSYDDDGKADAYLSVCSDRTAEKAMEAKSLHAQRLESIGALAGGVAHDLNNVLTPIIMAAPMLREDLPEDTREMIVDTIEESANRGAEMVRQVLTFARGVEGERVLIQVGHLMKDVVEGARKTLPDSLHLALLVSTRELWPVLGDAAQLTDALRRLTENAVQAMTQGGQIELAAENADLDESCASMIENARPGRYVAVSVTDRGKGIPQTLLARIFDPFFTTREQGKGSGLGLSTALGIVRSHGGFIRAESEPSKGSVFTIYLPRAADGAEESELPVDGDPATVLGRGELILLVDDEASILRVSARALEDRGYRVMAAGDGTEALARFAGARGSVKVVITDLKMPMMDGVVLVRTLRQMDPRVKVIVSTGHGDEDQLASLRSLGVKTTLKKPYTVEMLLRTVRQEIDAA